MRTLRAIAAVACFGACAFGGSAAWGCDERFPASCKSKTSTQAKVGVAAVDDASSAKRSERRRGVRSAGKMRFRAARHSARHSRAKLARLARYRRAEGIEIEAVARMPAEAPHRALRSRGFDLTGDLTQAGLLTPVLLGGTETTFTGPARATSTPALEVQAAKPIAAIAASHLLAASTSANAAEMLGIVPARAGPTEELRSTSLMGGWSESGIMRVLFLTLAGLLTFGTALRLAM